MRKQDSMKLRYALPAAAAALALSLPATAIAEETNDPEATQQQVENTQQEGTQQQENENQEPTLQEQIQQDLAEVPGLSEEQIARFNAILEQVAAGALDEDGAIEAVTAGLETNGISRETADYLLAEARAIIDENVAAEGIDEETVAGYYAIVESELDRLVAIHEANQAPEEEPKEAEISEEEKTEGEAAEESEKKDEEAAKNEQAQPASAEQPAKLANTGVSGALAGVGAGLAALALGGTALVAAQRKNA
ncbi:putative secreted protein [Corynebacterium otitidis ATCC 51513]|nr:putative secreted protein [Corynebacterium otitidis ATCC 51513]